MEEFANLLIPMVKNFDSNIGVYEAKKTMYRPERDDLRKIRTLPQPISVQ